MQKFGGVRVLPLLPASMRRKQEDEEEDKKEEKDKEKEDKKEEEEEEMVEKEWVSCVAPVGLQTSLDGALKVLNLLIQFSQTLFDIFSLIFDPPKGLVGDLNISSEETLPNLNAGRPLEKKNIFKGRLGWSATIINN